MNSRPEAWVKQAATILHWPDWPKTTASWRKPDLASIRRKSTEGALLELGIEPPHNNVLNDLVRRLNNEGIEVTNLNALPLRGLSRMAIQSRYPVDTPPADLFDLADAEQAIKTASAVLRIAASFDTQGVEGFEAMLGLNDPVHLVDQPSQESQGTKHQALVERE